jgi:hypothetical protein
MLHRDFATVRPCSAGNTESRTAPAASALGAATRATASTLTTAAGGTRSGGACAGTRAALRGLSNGYADGDGNRDRQHHYHSHHFHPLFSSYRMFRGYRKIRLGLYYGTLEIKSGC